LALESISFGPAARFWQRFKRHLAPAGGWRRCRGDGAANPAVNLGQFYSDPLNLRRGFPLAEICLLHYRAIAILVAHAGAAAQATAGQ